MLGLVKRTFTFMDKEMFSPLYKTLIRPHLEYATVVWSPFLKKDIFLIENVQRRATKLVKSIRNFSYEERMKRLGLPALRYRGARNDVSQVFKIMQRIDKLDVNTFFSKCQLKREQEDIISRLLNKRIEQRGQMCSHNE